MVENSINQRQIWGSLTRHLWPKQNPSFRLRVTLAILALVAAKVVAVLLPVFYEQIIDKLESNATSISLVLIIAYASGRFMQQLFAELRDILFARVSQRAQRTAALQVFQHLHNLSLQFHLNRQTGGLSQKLSRGLRAMQFSLGFLLFNIIPSIFELIMVGAILWYRFDPIYAFLVVFSILFYVLFTFIVTEWRLHYRKALNEAENKSSTFSVDSLLNYETVKYFQQEEKEAADYDRLLAKYESASLLSQRSLSVLNLGQAAIIALGLVAITMLSIQDVQQDKLTIGAFVLINSYLIQLYLPLNFLGFVYRELKQSFLDMESMFQLQLEQNEIQEPILAKTPVTSVGLLEFKKVSFSYGTARQILRDVSFKVEPGKTVGIVGSTGSGKSTIARLLYRFYDVSHGAVLLDNLDIKEFFQKRLRSQVAIVPQDTIMFNNTLRYNILYGKPNATEKELESAVQFASLEEFIKKLPKGVDTLVGERGLKLSGGERQRVALARVALLDPKILVLDEATSALDSKTENNVKSAIASRFQNITKVIIAHRLSTVVSADEIIVLENGMVAERGTHQDLLAQTGLYAALWTQQSKERATEL